MTFHAQLTRNELWRRTMGLILGLKERWRDPYNPFPLEECYSCQHLAECGPLHPPESIILHYWINIPEMSLICSQRLFPGKLIGTLPSILLLPNEIKLWPTSWHRYVEQCKTKNPQVASPSLSACSRRRPPASRRECLHTVWRYQGGGIAASLSRRALCKTAAKVVVSGDSDLDKK